MIKKLRSSRGYALAAFVVLMMMPGRGWGQGTLTSPVFQENLGTLSNATALTTSNTAFSYVRVSTSTTTNTLVNQIVSSNPGSFTGSSALISAKGASISTVDKTGLTSFSSGTFLFKFKTPSSLTSAVMLSAVGTGASFGSANGFTGTQLSAAFQVTGTNLQIRAANAWTTVQTVAVNTSYEVCIVFNNTAGALAYGNSSTLPSNKCHVWINGVYINEYSAATANLAASAFRIYTTTAQFEVDDVAVYSTLPTSSVLVAPTTQATNIIFSSVASTSLTASWTNGNGANRAVFVKQANTGTATPVDNATYTASTTFGSGTQIGSTGWYCVYNGSGTTVNITGLTATTEYMVHICEYNGAAGSELYNFTSSTNNPLTQTTSAGAIAPTITTPTATAIGLTSATLGGDITSDGGSSITERGTVWSLTTPVTITDNKLAEGGTTTGVFTQNRTSLPSGTLIYYAAYATNSVNTTLSTESSFTTLFTEPTNHATAFTAGTATSTSVPLTWTDATGFVIPNGYLIQWNTTGTFVDPVDGIAQANGVGIQNVASGVQTYNVTGLLSNTPYYFKIWPYTNSGTDINYKTDETVPTANATTLVAPSAVVTSRPSYIDLASATSESAVLMTLSNYSIDAAKYRLYATNQYSCWDEATDAYITSSTYSVGPLAPGTPTTSTTFWIVYQIGSNATTAASYRDRLDPYSSNYQTVALPVATAITTAFTLSGNFGGNASYDNSVKHVVLAYSGATLVSAAATTLSSGLFSVVCPDGTTIDKIEIRAINNTLIESLTGSWTVSTDIGSIPTTTFTGTGDWSASGNWSNGIPTSAMDAIIDGNVTVDVAAETKDLTIINYQTVTINDTKSLTVNGTVTNLHGASGLVVNSGGSLITNNSVLATVNRDYSGGTNFHYFCLPVSGASIAASPTFDGAWLDEYVESSGAWNRLGNADNVVSGKGYSINFEAVTTPLSFSGSINTVDQIAGSLSYTVAAPGYGPGWHLLGNPFTAALDLNSSSWVMDNVDAFAYVWDGSNYLVGPAVPADANGYIYGTLTDNVVPAMQGFFVHATADNASLTIPAAARTHNTQSFYKSTNVAKDALFLTINGNGYQDKAIVAFNPSATENFDGKYDAYKLFGIVEAPQLYSIIPGEKATVNTLPDYTTNSNVALGLKVGASTSYTINVSGIESFDASLPVRLDDLKLGTSQDMRINPVYTFDAAPGDAENRFLLSFASVTAVNELNASGIRVVSDNGIIRVTHNATATGTVYLYSVSGQLLATSTLNKGETTLRAASAGVYLVRVVTGKTSLTRKMVVVQ